MEEGGIMNAPNKIVRSETFPGTRHRQSASSAQDIDQRGSSSVPSFPGHLDLPTSPPQRAPYQQPDVSKLESNGCTNQRQEEDAGDASAEALWPLFVKIEPALSSLLRDLADWKAERKSQEESVQTDEREADESTESNEINEREKRFQSLNIYLPLYRAGLNGDWQATKAILDKYPDAVRAPITEWGGTILHVTAASKHHTYVKELVKLMTPDDLELKDREGNTTLCLTAMSGIMEIANEMVTMHNKLPLIRSSEGILPLLMASSLGNRNMVSFLLSATPFDQLTATDRIELLTDTIAADMYDIALDILKRDPTVSTAENRAGRIALEVLAKKPFALGNGSQQSTSWHKGVWNKALLPSLAHQLIEFLWRNIQILPYKQFSILLDKHSSFLFDAAELGNVEFLTILLRSHPDLICMVDESGRSLLHISILYRQESVFNIIYEIGTLKDRVILSHDKNGNNMLHFAGELAPSKSLEIASGAGATLRMQRELLWFKEIEKLMPPALLNEKNFRGQTPKDVFIETHRGLQKDDEKWMKDTINFCMLTATLVATVVFAAVFSVPGGTQNGNPFFLESSWFMLFFFSDAIALLFSTISIMNFLTIYTSRYTEEDFLQSLPSSLAAGISALFISLLGMVLAFCANCFLVYKFKSTWIPIFIIASAGVPIIGFVLLRYKLLCGTVNSTYWARILFRPRRHRLFRPQQLISRKGTAEEGI